MPRKTYKQQLEDEPLLSSGNWCGPNWTAGQIKPASEITPADYNVPAKSETDQKCKDHDIDIFEANNDPEKIKAADERFVTSTANGGFQERIMSTLVHNYGPAASLSKMPKYRLDKKKDKQVQEQREKYVEEKGHRIPITQDYVYPHPYKNTNARKNTINTKRGITPTIREINTGPKGPFDDYDSDIDDDQQFYQDVEDVEIMEELNNITPARKQAVDNGISPQDAQARSSLANLRSIREPLEQRLNQIDQNMDMEPQAAMTMAIEGGPATSNRQETAVDYFNQRELGILTNTRTAILPLTVYFSINMPQEYAPIKLSIRMNHWRNMFLNTSFVAQPVATFDTPTTSWNFPKRTSGLSADKPHDQQWRQRFAHEVTSITGSEGLRGKPVDGTYRPVWANYQRLMWYPNRLYGPESNGALEAKAGTAVTTIPAWAKWYEKIYDYMSVMETNYKLTIVPASEAAGETCDMIVFKQNDCKTATNTDDVMPVSQEAAHVLTAASSLPPDQLRKYKNIKKLSVDSIQSFNHRKHYLTDAGKYIPGSTKLIQNEEDIKTWYRTGQDYTPQWEETMNYYFYQKEFSSRYATCYHAKLEMAYIVQFKELKPKIRYHHPWKTAQQTNLILGVDDQQVPLPLYVNDSDREVNVLLNNTNGTVTETLISVPSNN